MARQLLTTDPAGVGAQPELTILLGGTIVLPTGTPTIGASAATVLRVGAHGARPHTFRKIRLRYIIHTGTKQTAVKLTE
jgi:hypothetical protein